MDLFDSSRKTCMGFIAVPILVSVLPTTLGFASLTYLRSTSGFCSLSSRTITASLSQNENLMTSEDEDILFGSTSGGPPFPARKRHLSRTGNLLESTNLPLNPLDHSSSDPVVNALRKMRDTATSCPEIWSELAKICGEKTAILDEHLCDERIELSFEEMQQTILQSAAVFKKLGVEKGSHVAILGENSARWLMVDHGLQLAGGVSAVRGADAPIDELRYIYEHSDSKNIVVLQGPKLLNRFIQAAEKSENDKGPLGLYNEKYGQVKTVVLMNKEKKSSEEITAMGAKLPGVDLYLFSDLLSTVSPLASPKNDLPNIGHEDLSTIVYTSGTTGRPKGVMLSHGNLLHQIGHRVAPTLPFEDAEPLPGEVMLSLLPVWHITERTFELWMFCRGCGVVYSSIRTFKNDLAKHTPQWMVLVPRVLEKVASGVQAKFASGSLIVKTLVKLFTLVGTVTSRNVKIAKGLVVGSDPPGGFQKLKSKVIVAFLYPINILGTKLVWSKVQEGFGGRLKLIISGGSALAGSLESFYETSGIPIIVGYGLTECSPLIAHRRVDSNLIMAGCVGKPTLDTEIRVVDPEAKSDAMERVSLPDGEAGVIIARGPQVMQGYYKNQAATNKAIDRYGWFDTGDLGRFNAATGDFILTGRCKDTIVLSNGENIEPSPIEDAILSESSLIDQVMLTGQDGRSLIAIAVLSVEELVNAGVLNKSEAKTLQNGYEKVNDPKCTEEESKEGCKILEEASKSLRSNTELASILKNDLKKATSGFRAWEQVGQIYITLEPFAMSNGLLTQSYKVKRNNVMERYKGKL